MGTTPEGVFILTPPSYPRGIILGDESQPSQTIYEESATQKYMPGTQLVYGDGRKFRYTKNGGTALTKALMTASEATYANCTAETQTTSGAAVDAGNQEITVDVTTGGTWVENEFAEGMLVVESSTGLAEIYKIAANKITATDTLMTVLLETAIRTSWSATTVMSMVKNRWRDVDVIPTTADGTPAGIPLINITADYYFWAQTAGYAPCIVDTSETIVKGEPVGFPTTCNVAGACGPMGADTDCVWGTTVLVVAAAGSAIINLKLD